MSEFIGFGRQCASERASLARKTDYALMPVYVNCINRRFQTRIVTTPRPHTKVGAPSVSISWPRSTPEPLTHTPRLATRHTVVPCHEPHFSELSEHCAD